jgi:hypothetical protein
MLPRPAHVGFHQHHASNLRHVARREGAHVVATEGVSDQDVRPTNTCLVKCGVQLVRDLYAGAREGSCIAETGAGAVIAAGPGPLGDLRLHDRPDRRPIFPARVEHDRGRASSHAVEIQPGSLSRHELPGPRIELITRSGIYRGGYTAERLERTKQCQYRGITHAGQAAISWRRGEFS